MSIPGNANPLLLASADGAAAAAGPTRSLRFNSGNSAYLNRTPSSGGNRRTFTFACWIKRAGLGASHVNIFAAGSNRFRIALGAGDGHLQVYEYDGNNFNFNKGTGALFRDPSAWYHLVVAIDTTDATAADRVKVYVNGSRITDFSNSDGNPSQNLDTFVNDTSNVHYIGTLGDSSNYLDAYLADVYFIDGSALQPTSFGAYDSNNVWQAAAYSGTFGTNGFHLLDFENESTVGHDSSGNENDFTANNLTASNTFSTNMTPSDTAYPNTTLSNGGLTWSGSTSNDTGTVSSLAIPTNKKTYVEVYHASTGGGNPGPGVANGPTTEMGLDNIKAWWRGGTDGSVAASTLGSFTGTNTSWSNGDILGIALDHTANSGNGSITFYKNGTQIHTGGSGWTAYSDLRFEWQNNGTGTSSGTWNYGASSFSYPVSGHTGLFESTSLENVLFDVPTNGTQSDTGAGGEVSGNYATMNSLQNGGLTLSNGNLDIAKSTGNYRLATGTVGISSGKYYWEYTVTGGADNHFVGVTNPQPSVVTYIGEFDLGWAYRSNGSKTHGNSFTTGLTTAGVGDVIQIAVDMTAGKIWFGVNNTYVGSGNPGTGANAAYSNLSGTIVPAVSMSGVMSASINFGARSFAYNAPSGFKALCTTNLPTPTIADGSDYFEAKLFSGNGSSQTISGFEFSPDFVWLKARNAAYFHRAYDSVRGATKELYPDDGAAQNTTTDGLTSFDSSGFTLGANAGINQDTKNYVAWAWDAGSSTASNTDGDIPSSVRASQASGFSIVQFEGSGTAGDSVGHGLSAAPELIFFKNIDNSTGYSWRTFTTAIDGSLDRLFLNGTNTKADQTGASVPDNSVFYVASNLDHNNLNDTIIAYCFTSVDQYSRIGVYTGNGSSSDGTFVFTGMRPRWVLIKATSISGQSWYILDAARDPHNLTANKLEANSFNAENASPNTATTNSLDLLSNGFKLRTNNDGTNQSSATYLYLAFAENPFQANGGLAR